MESEGEQSRITTGLVLVLIRTKPDAFGKSVRDRYAETQRTLVSNPIVAEGNQSWWWALEAGIQIEVIHPATASSTPPREKPEVIFLLISVTYWRFDSGMIVDKSYID